jgi:hypothetical protein
MKTILSNAIFTYGFEGDFNLFKLNRMEQKDSIKFVSALLGAKIIDQDDYSEPQSKLVLDVFYDKNISYSVYADVIIDDSLQEDNQEKEKQIELINLALFKAFKTSSVPLSNDDKEEIIDDWLDLMGLTYGSNVELYEGVISWEVRLVETKK